MERRGKVTVGGKKFENKRFAKVDNRKNGYGYKLTRGKYIEWDYRTHRALDPQNPWNNLKYNYERKKDPFKPQDLRTVRIEGYVTNESMKKYRIGNAIKNSRKHF